MIQVAIIVKHRQPTARAVLIINTTTKINVIMIALFNYMVQQTLNPKKYVHLVQVYAMDASMVRQIATHAVILCIYIKTLV